MSKANRKSGSVQSVDPIAAWTSGIQSRVKTPISERQKVQIQHFEERRNKLKEEYDDFQEARDSLDVMYKSMIREGERLREVRSNLVRMLFEENEGGGPVPEDLFPNYYPADPDDSDDAGSENDESREQDDVVVDLTDFEPKIQEEQDENCGGIGETFEKYEGRPVPEDLFRSNYTPTCPSVSVEAGSGDYTGIDEPHVIMIDVNAYEPKI